MAVIDRCPAERWAPDASHVYASPDAVNVVLAHAGSTTSSPRGPEYFTTQPSRSETFHFEADFVGPQGLTAGGGAVGTPQIFQCFIAEREETFMMA